MTQYRSRDSFIDEAKELINGDRASDYGDAYINHSNIAVGWTIIAKMAFEQNGNITASHVALMMDWVKSCRLANKIESQDSWSDKIGYSALGGEMSTKKSPADKAGEI